LPTFIFGLALVLAIINEVQSRWEWADI
jgi:hypothetical protein